MKVKVLFFGVLKDVTGTSFIQYNEVRDLSDLKHRIFDDFPQVVHYDYRILINNENINSNSDLKNDDEVAMYPERGTFEDKSFDGNKISSVLRQVPPLNRH